MALYEFKHNETGEIWEANMSYEKKKEYMEKNNCSSYFSKVPPVVHKTGDAYSKTDDSFKDRMKQINKNAGVQYSSVFNKHS